MHSDIQKPQINQTTLNPADIYAPVAPKITAPIYAPLAAIAISLTAIAAATIRAICKNKKLR